MSGSFKAHFLHNSIGMKKSYFIPEIRHFQAGFHPLSTKIKTLFFDIVNQVVPLTFAACKLTSVIKYLYG